MTTNRRKFMSTGIGVGVAGLALGAPAIVQAQSSQTFNWKANTCGDTELQIFVGDQTLTKVWAGEFGFSQFLNEFKTG